MWVLSPTGKSNQNFERLRAVGEWLSVNGDSIYGTTYGPVQAVPAMRTTAKSNRIFIHVFDWPGSALEVGDVKVKVLSARLLATGQRLNVTQTDDKLKIDLPKNAPDPNVSTIALATL